MDLQEEIKELKMMLSQIISLVQKPTEKSNTQEEFLILREEMRMQCYLLNLANTQVESPIPSLDV